MFLSLQVEALPHPPCEAICFLLSKDTQMDFPEVVSLQESTSRPRDLPSLILIALKPITRLKSQ